MEGIPLADRKRSGNLGEAISAIAAVCDGKVKGEMTQEQYERYEADIAKMRGAIKTLERRASTGLLSDDERELLYTLKLRSYQWEKRKGSMKPGEERGKERGVKRDKATVIPGQEWRGPVRISENVEILDDMAGYFGHGVYGNKEDRLGHIAGEWAKRRLRAGIKSAFEHAAPGWEGSKTKPAPNSATSAPNMRQEQSQRMRSTRPEGPASPQPNLTTTAWEEEDAEYRRWMEKVENMRVMAFQEDDPYAQDWYRNVMPDEAAQWYRRQMGIPDEVGQEGAMEGDAARSLDKMAEGAVGFIGGMAKTVRGIASGRPDGVRVHSAGPLQSEQVWVDTHERCVNGKRVRVQGHRRHVNKRAPRRR